MILKNLWRRKTRTFLTALGGALGVAAVISLTAFGQHFVDIWLQVGASPTADLQVSQKEAMMLAMSAVDDAVGEELRAMPGVQSVVGTVVGIVQLRDSPYFLTIGEDPKGFTFERYRVIDGERISGKRQIMLGALTSRNFKKMVGDKFGINEATYTVVGVYETGASFENGGAVISGSGKSTLLNLLGTLDRPTSGEVIINGKSLSRIRNLDRLRSRSIGFVFQMRNLIPTLTATENIEAPLHETTWNTLTRRRRAAELLDVVGLTPRRNYLPGQMSGGERQRVAIAQALANRPALVLADEPTGNLDTQNTADIMRLLQEINIQQGATLIAVTHNHEVASATGRIITLRDGRIQSDVAVTSAFDRDLIDFKESPFGRAIVAGEPLPPALQPVGDALHETLRRV